MTVGEKPVNKNDLGDLLDVAEQLEDVPSGAILPGVNRKETSSVQAPRIGELGGTKGLQARPSLKGVISPTRLAAMISGVRKECRQARTVLSGNSSKLFQELASLVVSEVERQLDFFLKDIPQDASLISSLNDDVRLKQLMLTALTEGGWSGLAVAIQFVRERHMMSMTLGKESRSRRDRLKSLASSIALGETASLEFEEVCSELTGMLRKIETDLDGLS